MKEIEVPQMKCWKCGKENPADVARCIHCRASLKISLLLKEKEAKEEVKQ